MTATAKSPMPPPPEWTTVEKEDAYHFLSQTGERMSSGMLKKFRDCPAAYHAAVTGQSKDKDSNAYRFGRAVHKICLEGIPAFNKSFRIGGPVNPKTGRCFGVDSQAYAAWLDENALDRNRVITEEEGDVLVAMANATARHPLAAAILDYGWPELVVRADLHGVPCQVRLDWLTHDEAGGWLLVDLKTTEDITFFQSDAYRYGYPHQFAFYRDVCQAATGKPFAVSVLAVEKKEPFRVGVWTIPPEVLDLHSEKNKAALEWFKRCQLADEWPTGYEEIRDFPMPRLGA